MTLTGNNMKIHLKVKKHRGTETKSSSFCVFVLPGDCTVTIQSFTRVPGIRCGVECWEWNSTSRLPSSTNFFAMII